MKKRKRLTHDPYSLEGIQKSCHIELVTGCWHWQGAVNAMGYGIVSYNRKTLLVRNVAFKLAHPEITDTPVLRDTCPNRSCVNPDHKTVQLEPTRMSWEQLKEHATLGGDCLEWRHPALHRVRRRVIAEQLGITLQKHAVVKLQCRNRLCIEPSHIYVVDVNRLQTLDGIFSHTAHDPGTDCYIWQGPVNASHGIAQHGGKWVHVQRLVYSLSHGMPLEEVSVVKTTCGRGLCVNAAHLKISGRKLRLSDVEVAEIRVMAEQGEKNKVIAGKFNITPICVSNIVRGRNYKKAA